MKKTSKWQNEENHRLIAQFIKNPSNRIFEELVLRYRPLIYRLLVQFQNLKLEREDFLQEAHLCLFESLNAYDESRGVTFGAFYHRRLTNHLLSLCRRYTTQKRKPSVPNVYLEEIACHEDGGEYNIESKPHQKVSHDQIMMEEEASTLSTLDYSVWRLYLKRYRLTEIAVLLDEPYGRIYSTFKKVQQFYYGKFSELDDQDMEIEN